MTTRDETATGKPAPRRKLGRGLGALLGEARREEPLVRLNPYLPSDDFGEREQTAHYEDGRYRGKPDTPPYQAAPFNGDVQKYNAALRERAQHQNEYNRIK